MVNLQIRFPEDLGNLWPTVRLVVLLISSKKLAGPVQEKKKKKKDYFKEKKKITMEPLEALSLARNARTALDLRDPVHSGRKQAPSGNPCVWSGPEKSGSAEAGGPTHPPTDYFREAGNPSNNGPTFLETGSSLNRGGRSCPSADPVSLRACTSRAVGWSVAASPSEGAGVKDHTGSALKVLSLPEPVWLSG